MNSFIKSTYKYKKNRAILSLGSNSTASVNIERAGKLLQKKFPAILFSTAQETEPIGMAHSPSFINQVAFITTSLTSKQLTDLLKDMEIALGRNPVDKEKIAIDIDLVQYNDQIMKPKEYHYPHVKQGLIELQEKIKQ